MFKNLSCLVTGGASGLGRGTVEYLSRLGARVMIADLANSNGVCVAEKLGGDNVVFLPTDVTSEQDVSHAIASIKREFGRLDLTVNCAGIHASTKTFSFRRNTAHSLAEFKRVLMINTVGTFNVVRLSAGLMAANKTDERGQRGVIINTASVAAFDGRIGQAAYAASKAAVAGMTLPISRDLSTHGIRVCSIAPGLFNTPMMEAMPEVCSTLAMKIPSPKRLGNASEYAHLVRTIYENPLLNGEVIRIDGGLRMMP